MNTRFSTVFFAFTLFLGIFTATGCSQGDPPAQVDSSAPVDSKTVAPAAPVPPESVPPESVPPEPVTPEPAEPKRMLPSAEEATGQDQDDTDPSSNVSINDPMTEEELETPMEEYVGPDQIAAKAFPAPPSAKAMSKANLWIDRDRGLVLADGYVAMNDGPLEMFACPAGTKEHESVVATIAKAREVHAALLAIGAEPGTPVSYDTDFTPATGQKIRVWVCYRDTEDKFQSLDARTWIRQMGTDKIMEPEWVFGGSFVWKDPTDGRNYYQADSGDMICVSNFTTAMMDIPVVSSADANSLLYEPYTERIPERGTPVRLVLQPLAIPSDDVPKPEQPTPPTEDVLGMKE